MCPLARRRDEPVRNLALAREVRHPELMRPDGWSSRLSIALFGALAASAAGALVAGCKPAGASEGEGVISLSQTAAAAATNLEADPRTIPKEGGPRLGAVSMAATIYHQARSALAEARLPPRRRHRRPRREARRVRRLQGRLLPRPPRRLRLRLGRRDDRPEHPILRALTRRPDLTKPMPYPYAFVRAIAPNYYRVPTKREQFDYEMALKEHLRSYKKLHKKWDEITVGANDVPSTRRATRSATPPAEPPERTDNELFGGDGDDAIPWFFQGGRRSPTSRASRRPTTRSSPTASPATPASPSSTASSARTIAASR